MTNERATMRGWLPAVWRRSAPALRWPALLAGLLVAVLLVAFYQVVSGGVRRAELRRTDAAAQADARQRCQAVAAARAREACLAGTKLSAAVR